jgi:hypothetical protein
MNFENSRKKHEKLGRLLTFSLERRIKKNQEESRRIKKNQEKSRKIKKNHEKLTLDFRL